MAAAAVLAALLHASCVDVPTGLPSWETRWVMPLERKEILVAGRGAELPPIDVPLEDLDDSFAQRVRDGGITVELGEPLDVDLGVTLRLTAPQVAPLVREIFLRRGQTVEQILLSGDELQSFLGRPGVTLSGSGEFSSPPWNGAPRAVTLGGTLEIVLTLGG